MAVRVNGHQGLECTTYEGVMFLATDTENYRLLSYGEYREFKEHETR